MSTLTVNTGGMKFNLRSAWPCLVILSAFMTACTVMNTATPSMPIAWHTTQSPLFPDEWPPTASTVWTRYTFAYGSNPGALADGAYVTLPLTRTELRAAGASVLTTTLRTTLESAGIQGLQPLDATSSAALSTGPQIQEQCLQLHTMPDETAAVELRGYYRVWVKLNGAFAKLIQPDHAAFFDWLNS